MTQDERNKADLSRLWIPRRYRIKEVTVYYYGLVAWAKKYMQTAKN